MQDLPHIVLDEPMSSSAACMTTAPPLSAQTDQPQHVRAGWSRMWAAQAFTHALHVRACVSAIDLALSGVGVCFHGSCTEVVIFTSFVQVYGMRITKRASLHF